MKIYGIIAALALVILASGCHSTKHVAYIQNADQIPQEVLNQIAPPADPVFQPGDLLNIAITGSNPVALAPFNRGTYVSSDGQIQNMRIGASNTTNNGASEGNTDYYLVDSKGNIDFPSLGVIHVAGLDKAQVEKEILDGIYPKYVKERPSVEVRLMNFKVTFLGAIRGNGTLKATNGRMNILEAVAEAGDLDIQGMRTNILLYRLNADGTREIHRLDLSDKNLLLSPYYNLQQNDIIYIEPNDSRKNNSWTLNPAVGATMSVIGLLSSISGLVVGIVNLAK